MDYNHGKRTGERSFEDEKHVSSGHSYPIHAGDWRLDVYGSSDDDFIFGFASRGNDDYSLTRSIGALSDATDASSAYMSAATIADDRANTAAVVDLQNEPANGIHHSRKIGIGTWDIDGNGTAHRDLQKFNFGWYYNWEVKPVWSASGQHASDNGFVPMIWGWDDVTKGSLRAAESASSRYLLGFNEPDNTAQSDLTVGQALKLWPKLMSTDKLLGSPAVTTGETLGADSWLGQFMDRAESKHYDVDFMAVHYYSKDPSISAFKNFLQDVYQEYHKPIWVTEWALVDWSNPQHFSAEQLAAFAENASHMMDDLSFVKRHAWFGAYAGGDGWDINSELLGKDGHLTPVGDAFADLTM